MDEIDEKSLPTASTLVQQQNYAFSNKFKKQKRSLPWNSDVLKGKNADVNKYKAFYSIFYFSHFIYRSFYAPSLSNRVI